MEHDFSTFEGNVASLQNLVKKIRHHDSIVSNYASINDRINKINSADNYIINQGDFNKSITELTIANSDIQGFSEQIESLRKEIIDDASKIENKWSIKISAYEYASLNESTVKVYNNMDQDHYILHYNINFDHNDLTQKSEAKELMVTRKMGKAE